MITKDKVTEIFCIIDEFDKNFEFELKKNESQRGVSLLKTSLIHLFYCIMPLIVWKEFENIVALKYAGLNSI